MNFLVACRLFIREGSQITLGVKGNEIGRIVGEVQKAELFLSERETLAELGNVKITNNMLEGW